MPRGRHEDRLVFDLQTAVAEAFGYRSTTPEGRSWPCALARP
jgi:[protein-PII] uridylyltransferase